MIADLAILTGAVAVAVVAGLVIGRMIARRIDRWQVRAENGAAESPDAGRDSAGKERVDDRDPS